MDKRQELSASLKELKGWGGLTVDLLAVRFVSANVARQAFDNLVRKARQSIECGRGVVIVCGTFAHEVTFDVAGIICPVWDTETNIRWLGDTTFEGVPQGPVLKLGDQNLDQFGWPSSLLTVDQFVIVQPSSAAAATSSQPTSLTPVRGSVAAPGKRDERASGTVSCTCGECGRQVYVGAAPTDVTAERLGETALYCALCNDIVCVRCGSSKMQKGGAVPCGKCGGHARSVDEKSHPSWYPGTRPPGGRSTPNPESLAPTPLLSVFSRDLTHVAKGRRAECAVVRENDLKRVISILCRQVRSNPLVVGETTTVSRLIVEVLANRISVGNVPEFLEHKRILRVDIPLLVAESRSWSDFIRRLGSVVKEAEGDKDVILLIEDVPLLFGVLPERFAAATSVLKRVIRGGRIQCIFTTERREIGSLMEEESSVGRYCELLQVAPASKDESLRALVSMKDHYECFHALVYTDDALQAAVDLAAGDHTGTSLLDTAMQLLDRAGVRSRLRLGGRPAEVEAVRARLKSIEHRMESAVAEHELDKAGSYSDHAGEELHSLRQLEAEDNVGDTVVRYVGSEDVHEVWSSREP